MTLALSQVFSISGMQRPASRLAIKTYVQMCWDRFHKGKRLREQTRKAYKNMLERDDMDYTHLVYLILYHLDPQVATEAWSDSMSGRRHFDNVCARSKFNLLHGLRANSTKCTQGCLDRQFNSLRDFVWYMRAFITIL